MPPADISNNVFTRDGTVDGDGFRGILTTSGGANDDLTVSQNSFTGWATGVYLNPGATDAIVSDNDFDGNFVGMSVDGPDNTTITGNEFTNNLFEGLGIGPGEASPSVTLSDNNFDTNTTHIGVYTDIAVDASANIFDGVDADAAPLTDVQVAAINALIGDAVDGGGYDGVVYLQPNTLFVVAGGSIQAAVDAAGEGDTIIVASGTFTETVTVDKALSFVGQGTDETFINPATGSGFVLAGDLGAANSVSFSGFAFTDASGSGILASYVTLGTLQVTNSLFDQNDVSGFRVLNSSSGSANTNLANVVLTDSTFLENGQPSSSSGDGDIIFYQYNGDVTLQNLTLDGGSREIGGAIGTDSAGENGIQFRSDSGSLGTVVIDNVSVAGNYEKVGIAFYNYDDIDGLTMSDVDVSATTGWGLALNFSGVGGDIDLASFSNLSYTATATIRAADDTEILAGGDGDDFLIAGSATNTLTGGLGTDTLTYALDSGGIDLSLATGTATDGSGGTDTLSGIENVIGSAFDDNLTGDSGDNILTGGDGSDTLTGGDGNDTFVIGNGDTGTDTITDFALGDILDLGDILVGVAADQIAFTEDGGNTEVRSTVDSVETTVAVIQNVGASSLGLDAEGNVTVTGGV